MTIHVFLGVGPANLHRALKIQKIDPTAKLVFIDKRLQPEHRNINRATARANIFRFETEDVTAKLIEDGVFEEELFPLIHQREFSVEQGFQSGDDKVFSSKPFTEIQIRDLQLLLMKTIDRKAGVNLPLLIARDLGKNENGTDKSQSDELTEEVALVLREHQALLDIDPSEKQDIKIHVATGVLTDAKMKPVKGKKGQEIPEKAKHGIIYPDRITNNIGNPTEDVAAIPVIPLHGTATFIITNRISQDELQENQRSLDLTPWQARLQKFGWNLVRPPRIRVFYANDILYIGTEIPVQMKSMSKEQYQQQIGEYTRAIAGLVFPDLPIHSLPINPQGFPHFPTGRGERGDVIYFNPNQELPWGEETIKANVNLWIHGDSRYLPHYQTGSGFVTAFLQNELYDEIYSCHSFAELVEWLRGKAGVEDTDPRSLQRKYMEIANGDAEIALETFQIELFMAYSHDILDENKKKVGLYFNAIHTQALNALGANIDELLNIFNHYQGSKFTSSMFEGLNSGQVAMELLKIDNVGFLRETLPRLLNMDFTNIDDRELLRIRDIHIRDFKKNIAQEGLDFSTSEEIIQDVLQRDFRELHLGLSVENVNKILAKYNELYKTSYKINEFNPAGKKILIMEMLNISGRNHVAFLREIMPLLTSEDLSRLSDRQLLNARDEFTKNYSVLLTDDYSKIISHIGASDELVNKLASSDASTFNELSVDLKLPFISKESDAQVLRTNLLFEAVKQNQSSHPFYKNVSLMIEEPDLQVLAAKLIAMAHVIDSNQELHQRAFLSFFTGKHSATIHQFAKDINVVAEQLKHPEILDSAQQQQLVSEAVNIMMKFHDTLEKGNSRRTMAALLRVTDELFSPPTTALAYLAS